MELHRRLWNCKGAYGIVQALMESYKCNCVGTNGLAQAPMELHRHQWNCIDCNGIAQAPMELHRHHWNCIDCKGIAQAPRELHRLQQNCIGSYGIAWVPMALHRHQWNCIEEWRAGVRRAGAGIAEAGRAFFYFYLLIVIRIDGLPDQDSVGSYTSSRQVLVCMYRYDMMIYTA